MKINNAKKIEKKLINNIKKLILEKGISNQNIANQLKVSKSTVSMWLSGKNKMSLEIIIEMANILNIPFLSLFENEKREQKDS